MWNLSHGGKFSNNFQNRNTILWISFKLIIVLLYIAIGFFNITVLTGALLGTIVTIVNFLILSYSVNKAVNQFMELRGDEEMNDEQAAAFAKANSLKIQNAVTKSYV